MRTELQSLILQQAIDMLDLTPSVSVLDVSVSDVEVVSLEDAGLEEHCQHQPLFGFGYSSSRRKKDAAHLSGGIHELIEWFSEGDEARWEMN